MVIEVCSGINADYLIIDGKRYNYGYDISKYPGVIRYGKELPTIKEMVNKADIIKAGINAFTGKPVSEAEVQAFIKEYKEDK
jgi:hypothetical protein